MREESSNNANNDLYTDTTNMAKEKMICKDGFCSLPNIKEIPKQNKNEMNFFDPIKWINNIFKIDHYIDIVQVFKY